MYVIQVPCFSYRDPDNEFESLHYHLDGPSTLSLFNAQRPFINHFENANFYELEKIAENNFNLRIYWKHNVSFGNPSSTLLKSDLKSNRIRAMGNTLLQKASSSRPSSYLPILYRYELALCYAESCEIKSKAYGNISAIYKYLNMFEHSLHFAEEALKFADSSSTNFINKLNERALLCKSEISLKINEKTEGKVDSDQEPFTSRSIKLSNEELFYTTDTLEPGDIIAVTKSFSFVGDHFFYRQNCSNCCQKSSTIMIPCDKCSHASFCSEECKATAMEGIHGFECLLLRMSVFSPGSYVHLALKFAWKALEIIKAGEDSTILNKILSMRKRPLSFTLKFVIIFKLKVILNFLEKEENPLKELVKNIPEGEKLFTEFFIKAYPVLKYNAFRSDFYLHIDDFYGNLEHSCRPNLLIFRNYKNGTNNYVVCQKIEPGEQLTVALMDTYSYIKPLHYRQQLFHELFEFECHCYACINNLPKEQIIGTESFYKIIDQKTTGGNFKELIKEFIRPDMNYCTQKLLYEHLFNFSLGQIDFARLLQAIRRSDLHKIEEGIA